MNDTIHEEKNGMSHYIVQNVTDDIHITQQFMLQKEKCMALKV